MVLDGDVYRQVYSSKSKLAATVIENYSLWSKNQKQPADTATRQSSTLFDTVAVYLAFTTDLCKMETLGIRVTDDGFTRIDPEAKKMQVATAWNNLDAFEKFLVQRLTGGARRDLN